MILSHFLSLLFSLYVVHGCNHSASIVDFNNVSTSKALTITETIDLSGPESNGTSYFPTPAVTLSTGLMTATFKYPDLTLATLLGHNTTILLIEEWMVGTATTAASWGQIYTVVTQATTTTQSTARPTTTPTSSGTTTQSTGSSVDNIGRLIQSLIALFIIAGALVLI